MIGDAFSFLLTAVIPFLLLISVVITVHELGHYWVGRMFNAAAESFAIGFGGPIFQVRDKRGTRWRLNWLPLGGFVKFVGEIQAPTDTRDEAKSGQHAHMDRPDEVLEAGVLPNVGGGKRAKPAKEEKPVVLVGKAYPELSPLKRMAVSLGGPFANFIFAIVVFAVMGMALGIAEAKEVRIGSIQAGSAAEAAGFKPGDVLLQAGGRKVETISDILQATQLNSGESVRYDITRNGEAMVINATPREEEVYNEQFKIKEKVGKVGLVLEEHEVAIRHLNPVEAVGYGVSSTASALGQTLNVMRRLVTGKDGLDKLSGPVGILKMTGSVTNMHMSQQGPDLGEKLRGLAVMLIQFAAMLSIGVGFFNLLPVPILDGGAVVMCLAEAVSGRDVPEKVQRVGLTIGLACLALFALVITWQDILK